jgi:hypothetical protein
VVETYDKHNEAEAIAEGAQSAVAALAAVEVGALSLGTLIAVLATTAAADVTGVLLAGVVATLGLFVIPARRRQAKNEMREKIAAMREQLMYALHTQFEREVNRSVNNIQEAVGPYSRSCALSKETARSPGRAGTHPGRDGKPASTGGSHPRMRRKPAAAWLCLLLVSGCAPSAQIRAHSQLRPRRRRNAAARRRMPATATSQRPEHLRPSGDSLPKLSYRNA